MDIFVYLDALSVTDAPLLLGLLSVRNVRGNIGLVLSTSEFYGYGKHEAKAEVYRLKTIINGWRSRANAIGLPKPEQDRFQPAFQNL